MKKIAKMNRLNSIKQTFEFIRKLPKAIMRLVWHGFLLKMSNDDETFYSNNTLNV